VINKPLRRRRQEDDSDFTEELTDHEVDFTTTQQVKKNSKPQVHDNDIPKFSLHSYFFFKRKNREKSADSDFSSYSRENLKEIE
jgi:hypothetical protein